MMLENWEHGTQIYMPILERKQSDRRDRIHVPISLNSLVNVIFDYHIAREDRSDDSIAAKDTTNA
jgi:hypothetical protein